MKLLMKQFKINLAEVLVVMMGISTVLIYMYGVEEISALNRQLVFLGCYWGNHRALSILKIPQK